MGDRSTFELKSESEPPYKMYHPTKKVAVSLKI